jgi:hypothetical protein
LEAGLEASANAQETNIERRVSGADELLARFDNALIREQEDSIRQELNNNRVDNPTEREKVLVRHLAVAVTYSRFEQVYYTIYGSQIRVLQALNAAGSSHKDNVKAYYDLACLSAPSFYSNYSFDQWLNYMQSRMLLRIDGGDMVSITVFGREFLTFLVQEGRSIEKLG